LGKLIFGGNFQKKFHLTTKQLFYKMQINNQLAVVYGVLPLATDSKVPNSTKYEICQSVLSLCNGLVSKEKKTFEKPIAHVIGCAELGGLWVSFRMKNKDIASLFPLSCAEIQRSFSFKPTIDESHIPLIEMMFLNMINNLPYARIRFNGYLNFIRIYNKVIIMEVEPSSGDTLVLKRNEMIIEKNY